MSAVLSFYSLQDDGMLISYVYLTATVAVAVTVTVAGYGYTIQSCLVWVALPHPGMTAI